MLSSADVVLIAGARLDWIFRYGSEVNSDAQVVHIDIYPVVIEKNVKKNFINVMRMHERRLMPS